MVFLENIFGKTRFSNESKINFKGYIKAFQYDGKQVNLV
jgi:hypothetical protein